MDQELAYAVVVQAYEKALEATEKWLLIVRDGAMDRRGMDPVDYVQDPAYSAAVRI